MRMSDARETPNYAMLADTSDGEGVESWVSFAEKEDMGFFERDSELLAFASLNPSPLILSNSRRKTASYLEVLSNKGNIL